jgi:myosin tail region-interacting protein MTI1
VKGKYDYDSGHEDDLSFNAGQIIIVTEEVDEEWYQGEYIDDEGRQRQGMFPRNFVVPLKPRTNASHGSPPSSKQDPVAQPVQPSSNVRGGSNYPGQTPNIPVLSSSAPRSSAKMGPASGPPSEAESAPPRSVDLCPTSQH